MQEEKYLSQFDQICTEDVEEVVNVCSTASTILFDLFKLKLDDPKLVGIIWSKTFDAIIEELKDARAKHPSYEINIGDRLCIGYTTTDSDEEEKTGNFMIYINHKNIENHYDTDIEEINRDDTKTLCTTWIVDNITKDISAIHRIQSIAIDKLKKIDVLVGGTNIIMPVFIIVYESLVKIMKIRRVQLNRFEYEINFLSCFNITARENEEGDSDISIRPNINSKLEMKSDKLASSIHDD